MTENIKPFYFAAEIPMLLGPATPSLSSFYRYVSIGQIRKVDFPDQFNTAYSGEDVRRFLKGEMSRKKGGTKRETAAGGKPIIDYVRDISDLAHTSSMELKLPSKGSLSSKTQLAWISTQLSWIEKNEYACWFLSHPKARDNVWATLVVLPMPEEKLFRLLKDEITLQDVTSDDVLAYNPELSPFFCYMSAVVKPDREELLLELLQHVFAFWCEKVPPGRIDKLYVLVPTGMKGTPFHKLVKKFYFSPARDVSCPPDQTVWELDFTFFNPSEEIQKVQKCFQEEKKEGTPTHQEVGTSP